jgi:hypothetical protein
MLCHCAECHYGECRVVFTVMLNVVMLSVVMVSDLAPFKGAGANPLSVAPFPLRAKSVPITLANQGPGANPQSQSALL